jgi:hypothetical protein
VTPLPTLAHLRSRWAGRFVAVLCVLAAHLFWQGHGVVDPAFRNPDVAGIAYNARLFAAGSLPYVASAEIKPPGAFLLFAPLLAVGGMRLVWAAAVVWGVALSLATGVLARASFGGRAGPRAAVLHAVCAAIASDGDINYSFWMATPFTLAAATAAAAVSTPHVRRAAWLWFASGALALLAVSIKPSAWPVSGVFVALLAREVARGRRAAAVHGVVAGLAGALATALLIALPYALAAELGALRAGLSDVAGFGNEYVAVVRQAIGSRTLAIAAGLPCLFEQIPGLLVLGVLGAGGLFGRAAARAPLALAAWTFAGAAFVAVAYTLRFFSHDNAALWPALAVLAVRPAGFVARALDRVPAWPGRDALAAALLGLLAAWPGARQRWDYVHFMAERDHEVQDLCTAVGPALPAREPVLAWGWSAWSVYEHCGRRAPGRVFKVIASVTTVNTNTCNNGFGPMRIRSGPEPARFLAELERRPPALVLWSSYFREMGGDPLETWAPLAHFIEDRYTAVASRGPFVALLRRDLLPGEERVAAQGSRGLGASSGGNGVYASPGRAGSVWTSTSRTPANASLMASMTSCVTR